MNADVQIPLSHMFLNGHWEIPTAASGVVLFAHGSGSSRSSPRNRRVAAQLHEARLGTLLFDLLTEDEEERDRLYGGYRFNIDLLTHRLVAATDWVVERRAANGLPLGYFGASTGAAAAMHAAAERAHVVRAIVSRGGRPDLAGEALERVSAPTLLIVGGADGPVIRMNEDALQVLRVPKRLAIVPGAGHLFEEPGALDAVARLAREWFLECFAVDAQEHAAARSSGAAV
jgi:pimeloyl-ACP methyl ester carboxylesterase